MNPEELWKKYYSEKEETLLQTLTILGDSSIPADLRARLFRAELGVAFAEGGKSVAQWFHGVKS